MLNYHKWTWRPEKEPKQRSAKILTRTGGGGDSTATAMLIRAQHVEATRGDNAWKPRKLRSAAFSKSEFPYGQQAKTQEEVCSTAHMSVEVRLHSESCPESIKKEPERTISGVVSFGGTLKPQDRRRILTHETVKDVTLQNATESTRTRTE